MTTARKATSVTLTEVARDSLLLRVGNRPLAHTLLCPRPHTRAVRRSTNFERRYFRGTGDRHRRSASPAADMAPGGRNPGVGDQSCGSSGGAPRRLRTTTAGRLCGPGRASAITSEAGQQHPHRVPPMPHSTCWLDAFDRVLRHFTTPLRMPPRIIFPDRSPAVVAFVEPLRAPSGGRVDPRPTLRGGPSTSPPRAAAGSSPMSSPTWCTFPTSVCGHRAGLRCQVSAVVGDSSSANRLTLFHHTSARTSRTVAWLEAWGLCAERFYWYCREVADRDTQQTDRRHSPAGAKAHR